MNTLLAPNASTPAKKLRMGNKLRKALYYLATGKARNQREAAKLAKMSESQLSRRLQETSIRVVLRSMASANISDAAIRASSKVQDLIDSASEHVSAKVCLRLLEAERLISPAGTGGPVVNIGEMQPGYVVRLDRSGLTYEEALRDPDIEMDGSGTVLKPRPGGRFDRRHGDVIDITPGQEGEA